MRFEDFVLHLDSCSRGGFRARVLKSPFGEGAVGFSLPSVASAEPAIHSAVTRDVVRQSAAPAGARPLEIGNELFRSVFQGQVRMLLDKSRGRLELSPNLGLRIKVKIDPADEEAGVLADLPWELLCDREAADVFVLSRQMSVVRYLDVPRPSHPISFTPPLRILAVSASPRGLEELDLGEEERRLDALNQSSSGVLVRFLHHASMGAVREALSNDTYNVLHFMGHGTFNPEAGEGVLAFEAPDGSSDLVSGKVFAMMLQDLRSLGVVVLNACNTALAHHQRSADPFRGVANALVLAGIPAVVAMQRPISDKAAIGFSSAFYRLLACCASIDEALTEGRQALHAADPCGFEWATPVLFLRTPEGHVFRSTLAELHAPAGPPIVPPRPSRIRPVLTFLGGAAASILLMVANEIGAFSPPAAVADPPIKFQGTSQVPEAQTNVYISLKKKDFHTQQTNVHVWQAAILNPPSDAQSSPIPPAPPAVAVVELAPASPVSPARSMAVQTKRIEEERFSPTLQTVFTSYTPADPEEIQPPPQIRLSKLSKSAFKLEQILACIKQRAWIAYFQNDEGELAPVRDTLNIEDDGEWIGLRFTEFDGPRIRLGVLKVINKSAESEERGYADRIEVPVAGIQEMLTVALYNTKRFDVIEQKRVQEVQDQQKRKDVVEPSPTSIVNMGKVLGAQYLVYSTVNEWNPERASRNMGPGRVFSAGKKEAEVSITFTLTDVGTGQILFTTMERARIGEWSIGFGGSGGEATQQNTPITHAVHACANKAALKIATFLSNRKWRGSVVDLKRADIYINAGSQQGMGLQTKLSVQAVKGVVKDRESGTVLGEDLRTIGNLEVVSVQTGFSIAQVVDGCKGMKVGDRVELATPPAPPPISPECAALDVTMSAAL